MKKFSPEFLAQAKKKCKVPCIVLAIVLVFTTAMLMVYLYTQGTFGAIG